MCIRVLWVILLQSVSVQKGDKLICCQSGLVSHCDQVMRYDAGFALPVLMP